LPNFVDSFRKFALVLGSIVVLGFGTVYLFDQFIAAPIDLPLFFEQALRIVLILGFWVAVLLTVRRAKSFMAVRIGSQAATVLQYLIGTFAVIVMGFGVLHTIGVSPESLLTGAGIVSITIGLVISTFVGGILSGALVYTSHRFRVGDNVVVNNIPGKVTDLTALVTRVRTDIGQMSIPNSAIASGTIIVTLVHKYEAKSPSRLPYATGDRVVTTYMNGVGTVIDLTPLQTVILLDSGNEVTFLNSSVLSGTVAVARVCPKQTATNENKLKSES